MTTEIETLRTALQAAQSEREEVAKALVGQMKRADIAESERDANLSRAVAAESEASRLRDAAMRISNDVEQTLGKAMGYPWYKDDLHNFPNATEANGVCVGEHVAETIAAEAANRLVAAELRLEAVRAALGVSLMEGNYD